MLRHGFFLILFGAATIASAADPLVDGNKVVPRETVVSIEIITGEFGAGIHAQNWSRELSKLGHSIQIRQARGNEEPAITERMLGRIRNVRVVGGLDGTGTLFFPKQNFRPGDAAKLAEWIEELQTYGADGSPRGKPVWGLNQPQFEQLLKSLGTKIEQPLVDKSLAECLQTLPVSKALPVVWSIDAREALAERVASPGEFDQFPAWQQVEGMSLGSGLALVLSHYGFGFRPNRTPAGTIELLVEPIEKGRKQWPIGWPSEVSPDLLAPKYLSLTNVNLNDAPLFEVTQAISTQTDTPIVFHLPSLEAERLKPTELKVSHKPARRNWSLVLTSVLSQHKLIQRLLVDEAGRPFVLIRSRKSLDDETFK